MIVLSRLSGSCSGVKLNKKKGTGKKLKQEAKCRLVAYVSTFFQEENTRECVNKCILYFCITSLIHRMLGTRSPCEKIIFGYVLHSLERTCVRVFIREV